MLLQIRCCVSRFLKHFMCFLVRRVHTQICRWSCNAVGIGSFFILIVLFCEGGVFTISHLDLLDQDNNDDYDGCQHDSCAYKDQNYVDYALFPFFLRRLNLCDSWISFAICSRGRCFRRFYISGGPCACFCLRACCVCWRPWQSVEPCLLTALDQSNKAYWVNAIWIRRTKKANRLKVVVEDKCSWVSFHVRGRQSCCVRYPKCPRLPEIYAHYCIVEGHYTRRNDVLSDPRVRHTQHTWIVRRWIRYAAECIEVKIWNTANNELDAPEVACSAICAVVHGGNLVCGTDLADEVEICLILPEHHIALKSAVFSEALLVARASVRRVVNNGIFACNVQLQGC